MFYQNAAVADCQSAALIVAQLALVLATATHDVAQLALSLATAAQNVPQLTRDAQQLALPLSTTTQDVAQLTHDVQQLAVFFRCFCRKKGANTAKSVSPRPSCCKFHQWNLSKTFL